MSKRISKELIWVWLLYLSAGYLNALTLLLFSETAVGQTGRMTSMVFHFFQNNEKMAYQLLFLSIAFLAGAVLSGLFFSRRKFDPQNKKVGWVPILLGTGLILVDFIPDLSPFVLYYVCLLLGVQNSLYVSYRNSSVSSTALTSAISNFGAAIGNLVRGEKESVQRIIYFSGDVLAHILGASLCFALALYNNRLLLEMGALLYIIIGGYFWFFRKDFSIDGSSIG